LRWVGTEPGIKISFLEQLGYEPAAVAKSETIWKVYLVVTPAVQNDGKGVTPSVTSKTASFTVYTMFDGIVHGHSPQSSITAHFCGGSYIWIIASCFTLVNLGFVMWCMGDPSDAE